MSKTFFMNNLKEASYILGTKIYRDRTNKLLSLSQYVHIDKLLKRFSMDESKKGFLPTSYGVLLSRKQSLKIEEERKHMNKIPYASAIRSII